ncbi:S8 family peptidase [candidate division KSB1 bacterium]|nr:S8 family peptidase [candidate division KSB1 bacterium]
MTLYEHLPLYPYQGEVQRQMRGGGGGYRLPEGREKSEYSQDTTRKVDQLVDKFNTVKRKYSGIVKPSLIFEIEINQSVDFRTIEQTMSSMGIHVLASAENKKGWWILFSDDENLNEFKRRLASYGSAEGPNYDFFNALGILRDIPGEEKMGERLKKEPLGEIAEFIDIELWRMIDEQKNIEFIKELKSAYPDRRTFRITDQLITKSFVLIRAQLNKTIFDEIIELKEIARVDRPALMTFNPFEYKNIDISAVERNEPGENASGILIIDSGIISNHPLLEKCVGGEANFQNGEFEAQDTVGHGTAVAGCAAYGDIEKCIQDSSFNPANWIYSAKVMYAERNPVTGQVHAVYDPEKLVEHQLQDAIFSFLSNSDFQIRVVNISLGNALEIWHHTFHRQLPLASLVDELAFLFPNVVFIVSTGNQDPKKLSGFDSIDSIKERYPQFLLQNPHFNIINPATSAHALTVGSIAPAARVRQEFFGEEEIKIPLADENQPSPFTRCGPGINGMIKPELVEYGGNLIIYSKYGRILEDMGGKIGLLNNQTTNDIIKFDYGTSFSAPKIGHIAGQIANRYPQRSANFIKNMLLASADFPFIPDDGFYSSKKGKAIEDHLSVCGYGLPSIEKAIYSFDNRVILFEEGKLQLNKVAVYSLQLPDVFFMEKGYKRIMIVLAFTPETRSTRGDSYLGNRMEFHLFHSVNPQELVNKYGIIDSKAEGEEIPEELKGFEIKLTPGTRKRNAGCHQKAWKEFKREPRNRPASPISLVLINYNKWINDETLQTDFCLSVIFEHEKEVDLYNQIRANIQARARIR